jgi:hypothetical protein
MASIAVFDQHRPDLLLEELDAGILGHRRLADAAQAKTQ